VCSEGRRAIHVIISSTLTNRRVSRRPAHAASRNDLAPLPLPPPPPLPGLLHIRTFLFRVYCPNKRAICVNTESPPTICMHSLITGPRVLHKQHNTTTHPSLRERKNLRTFKHELWAVRYFPPALNARLAIFLMKNSFYSRRHREIIGRSDMQLSSLLNFD
jgi:hypothetical protein